MEILSLDEYLQIAKIHKRMLKNSGFLSDCSTGFIKIFYERVHKFDTSIIIIDKLNNSDIVKGFAFLSMDSSNYFNKFFLQNWFRIIVDPYSLFAFIKAAIRKMLKTNIFKYNVELVHIAVDHAFQGTGVGKKLIHNIEEKLLNENIKEYYLQVFDDNLTAKNLYINNKFKIVSSFKIGSRNKLLMKKDLY